MNNQLDTLRSQCADNETMVNELEALRREAEVKQVVERELELLRQQCADRESVVSELEALKQQALKEVWDKYLFC